MVVAGVAVGFPTDSGAAPLWSFAVGCGCPRLIAARRACGCVGVSLVLCVPANGWCVHAVGCARLRSVMSRATEIVSLLGKRTKRTSRWCSPSAACTVYSRTSVGRPPRARQPLPPPLRRRLPPLVVGGAAVADDVAGIDPVVVHHVQLVVLGRDGDLRSVATRGLAGQLDDRAEVPQRGDRRSLGRRPVMKRWEARGILKGPAGGTALHPVWRTLHVALPVGRRPGRPRSLRAASRPFVVSERFFSTKWLRCVANATYTNQDGTQHHPDSSSPVPPWGRKWYLFYLY